MFTRNVIYFYKHLKLGRKFAFCQRCRFISNETKESVSMIRNVGIIAHIDAGKTTTTERMLYYTGFTKAPGDVHDGDTVMDYMLQERERGITITAAAITFKWNDYKINLIDTPGHVDFTVEVERSLRVLDGAVTILDGSVGVEAQTLTVWNQAERYNVPRIVYINKMDKPKASLSLCLQSIRQKLRKKPLLLQLPLYRNGKFYGVVDLVSMKACSWMSDKSNETQGRYFEVLPIGTENELCNNKRKELLESLAEADDRFLEVYLSDTDNVPLDELIPAIRRVTLQHKLIPVLVGSSYKNVGVQPLLDAISNYLPDPDNRKHDFIRYYDDNLCCLAFKIAHHKHKGPLTFCRVYSGTVVQGQKFYNINRDVAEKSTKILMAYADEFAEVPSVSAGNIAVVTGLKEVITGDTLVANRSASEQACKAFAKEHDIEADELTPVLAAIQVPEPVFFCSIESPSLSQQKQLEYALQCLQREDPTFKVEHQEDTGQTVISGMGQLHIDVIKDRIAKEYKVDPFLGPLQVAYRETISVPGKEQIVTQKVVANIRNHVEIGINIHPATGQGRFQKVKVIITDENDLGKLRPQHQKALETGIHLAFSHGPLLGFPVIDVSVSLDWFKTTSKTSLSMITATASQCALAALKKCSAVLLEPVMKLEIYTPASYIGRLLSDLSQRRSTIGGIMEREDVRIITTLTPLSELVDYSTALRTLSSGAAHYHIELHSYQTLNAEEQKKAIEQITGFAPF